MKILFMIIFFVIFLIICINYNCIKGQENDMKLQKPIEMICPEEFFDINCTEEENNYNTLFSKKWTSLKEEFGKRISSSGIFGWYYLYFEENNKFKMITGFYNPIHMEKEQTQQTGVYRFDNENKILYLKYSTGIELVFETKYYKYNEKSWDNWEYILVLNPLNPYENTATETPFNLRSHLERQYLKIFATPFSEVDYDKLKFLKDDIVQK